MICSLSEKRYMGQKRKLILAQSARPPKQNLSSTKAKCDRLLVSTEVFSGNHSGQRLLAASFFRSETEQKKKIDFKLRSS